MVTPRRPAAHRRRPHLPSSSPPEPPIRLSSSTSLLTSGTDGTDGTDSIGGYVLTRRRWRLPPLRHLHLHPQHPGLHLLPRRRPRCRPQPRRRPDGRPRQLPRLRKFRLRHPLHLPNEVSTVAAAYAFSDLRHRRHRCSSNTALAQTGIANALANATNLADLASGAALTTTPAGNGTVLNPRSTLANILAACINSTGLGLRLHHSLHQRHERRLHRASPRHRHRDRRHQHRPQPSRQRGCALRHPQFPDTRPSCPSSPPSPPTSPSPSTSPGAASPPQTPSPSTPPATSGPPPITIWPSSAPSAHHSRPPADLQTPASAIPSPSPSIPLPAPTSGSQTILATPSPSSATPAPSSPPSHPPTPPIPTASPSIPLATSG